MARILGKKKNSRRNKTKFGEYKKPRQRASLSIRAGASYIGPPPKNAGVKDMTLKRGDIFFAELNPVQGSEQGGVRPVLVVQNDVGNNYSPTTIVLPITSRMSKAKLPTHVALSRRESGLSRDSVVLAEQIRTIDKVRLQQKVATLNEMTMARINNAMEISMGIAPEVE